MSETKNLLILLAHSFCLLMMMNESGNPVRLKLQNLINSPAILQPQVADALNIISDNFDLKQTSVRRSLPELLNAKRVSLFTEFMTTFNAICGEVESLEGQFAVMKKQYLEMSLKWKGIKNSTKTLFKDSLELHGKKKELEERAKEAEQFYRDYSLKEEDMVVLEESQISSQFFEALEKINEMRIRIDQLSSPSVNINSPTSGSLNNPNPNPSNQPGTSKPDSMRSTVFALLSDYEEVAVQKLYQWLQNVVKINMSVESPDLSPIIFKAFASLSSREILWQSCIDEMSYQRRSAIAKAFMDALIKGGPNGNPRPIEFHAYDSVRYIGDILAWTHQMCASEFEMLNSILVPSKKDLDFLKKCMDSHTETLPKTLESRISQIFQTQRPFLVLFRINHLILFYSSVFTKFLSQDSALLTCIKSLYIESLNHFEDSLKLFSNTLASIEDKAPPKDLLPPKAIRETVSNLKEMTRVFEASSSSSSSSPSSSSSSSLGMIKVDFRPILSGLMDPLMQFAISGSSSLSKLEQPVYMINCLLHLLYGIRNYQFTVQKVDEIQGLIDIYTKGLSDELSLTLAVKCGLTRKPPNVTDINLAVEALVNDPTANLEPELLAKISNNRISNSVRATVLHNFVSSYSASYPHIPGLSFQPSQISKLLQQ